MRPRPLWLFAAVLLLLAPCLCAQVNLVLNGTPQAVIMTRPSAPGYIALAAQELQDHVQRMTGAMLPIALVGSEASYPGKKFVYVGVSTASTAAGINTSALVLEQYVIRTMGGHLYIVGRDGGQDDWANLSDCQPGTLFGVYHLLGDILGVRWIWPGESGVSVPTFTTLTVPALNLTTGPAMVQRKYRTPRIGLYLGTSTSYGFGVPLLASTIAQRTALALDELKWLRRMRMGTRKNTSFAHSFTQWWPTYGATHPEYFATLLPGKAQPHPGTDRVKLHVSGPAVWQAKIDEWVAVGASSSLNICPNDSRSHCVCAQCLAWDRPSQAADVVIDSSDALLGDRYARFYTEIANRARAINPNVTVFGYAYDVYQNAPREATVPDNVALAYVPGAPSDTTLDGIAETEANVLGWIAHGCTQMYLRPNWMLSAHAGPFWPAHRLGEHFKRLTAGGAIKGIDSDSSCSSYATFGPYYYLLCRLIADPSLSVDAVLDEFCSGFGSAAPQVRNYLTYWENFAYTQADAGNTDILAWANCMAAYPGSYTDRVFDGAERNLDAAYAALLPSETAARARLDFLKTACLHGRLTSQAIALVDPVVALASNPEAERAMRSLLAYRDQNADGYALWREWLIDRESFVPNMKNYWTSILATPDVGNGSNVGAFIESGGQVVLEAEHFSASLGGTGTAAGLFWQENASFTGASGTVMQALPNNGVGTDTAQNGPRLDFKIDFHTPGTYYIFLHLPTLPGGDDSVNVGLDGTLISSNLGNTSGSWRWRTTTPATVALNIPAPGVHTFNVWMREVGCVVDKIILTTNAALSLAGTSLGPAESGLRGSTEHLLTVGNGTGDGWYGEETLVPITAYTAPANQVFDRWTGDTQYLASATSPTTYAQIPLRDMRIAATYKLSPSLDADSDGIPDAWETTNLGSVANATATSDFDHDGLSDRAEYLAGTNPKNPASSFRVTQVSKNANGDVTVQWPSVLGKTYTVEVCSDLATAEWTPIAVGVPGGASATTLVTRFTTPAGFLRVLLE